MGLEMRAGLDLRQEQKIYLDQKQTLVLKQLLKLKSTHEDFPNAAKGIEGLRSADSFLKQLNLKGILIGGLSEAAWNPDYTEEDFAKHKDIDILIPSIPENVNIGRLEKGIDWWLPLEDRLTVNYLAGSAELDVKYWVNAFDVRLSFGVNTESTEYLPSGLYIPSRNFVIGMRAAEAFAQVNTKAIPIDSDVEEKFYEELKKKITHDVSPVIVKEFGDPDTSNFDIKYFDHETVLAINEN